VGLDPVLMDFDRQCPLSGSRKRERRSNWRAGWRRVASAGWFSSLLLFGHALAPAAELQNDAVVHQTVHGGHCRYGVVEDALPLAEDQVGADHPAAALIAFGEEGEEHFHLPFWWASPTPISPGLFP
jgi:hypothetical protein